MLPNSQEHSAGRARAPGVRREARLGRWHRAVRPPYGTAALPACPRLCAYAGQAFLASDSRCDGRQGGWLAARGRASHGLRRPTCARGPPARPACSDGSRLFCAQLFVPNFLCRLGVGWAIPTGAPPAGQTGGRGSHGLRRHGGRTVRAAPAGSACRGPRLLAIFFSAGLAWWIRTWWLAHRSVEWPAAAGRASAGRRAGAAGSGRGRRAGGRAAACGGAAAACGVRGPGWASCGNARGRRAGARGTPFRSPAVPRPRGVADGPDSVPDSALDFAPDFAPPAVVCAGAVTVGAPALRVTGSAMTPAERWLIGCVRTRLTTDSTFCTRGARRSTMSPWLCTRGVWRVGVA